MTRGPHRRGPRVLEYANPHQRIFRQDVLFDGFTKIYYPSEHGARVGVVVPRGARPEILLVRQYRLLIDGLSWEIPGGRVDEGETPENAARRECREEAGLACTALTPLVRYLPGMDNYDNPTHVFAAEAAGPETPFVPAPREVVERHWVALDRALAMIAAGEIVCALTMIGLYAYVSRVGNP